MNFSQVSDNHCNLLDKMFTFKEKYDIKYLTNLMNDSHERSHLSEWPLVCFILFIENNKKRLDVTRHHCCLLPTGVSKRV